MIFDADLNNRLCPRQSFFHPLPETEPKKSVIIPYEAIWLTGAIILFTYFCFIYIIHLLRTKNKKELSTEILNECKKILGIKRQVFIFEGKTPMLMGIIKPKIIIPDGYSENEQRNIVIHELCHLKNNDILFIWIAVIILCLNWFNPVIWYSFFLFRRDIEVYCDERVLKYTDSKKDYAQLLLKTALEKNRFVLGTTSLQNGEKEVERRIKYMAYFKKPKFIWSFIILALVVAISVICLTNGTNNEYYMDENRLAEYVQKPFGAIPARIDYADKDKVVFHYLTGLFVYDIEKSEITKSFDLEKFNCAPHQQGSFGLEIAVSNDGKRALLTNYGREEEIKDFENYIINLGSGKVRTTDLKKLENPFSSFVETSEAVPDAEGFVSYDCAVSDGKNYYLTSITGQINDLKLFINDIESYIFPEKFISVSALRVEKIEEVLPKGARVFVNSGYGWNIRIYEEGKTEARKIAESVLGNISYEDLLIKLGLKIPDLTGKSVYIYGNAVDLGDGNSTPYVYIFDNETNELLTYGNIKTLENERIVIRVGEALSRYSGVNERTELYKMTKKYLKEEFERVYTPYYEILLLYIQNWQENGNEATFCYTMEYKNYDRDPDTIDYIKEAKENGSKYYEQLKREYLEPKTVNYEFKVINNNGKLELYTNIAPKGEEWQPVKVDDFISSNWE